MKENEIQMRQRSRRRDNERKREKRAREKQKEVREREKKQELKFGEKEGERKRAFPSQSSRLCLGRELGFHRDPPRLGLGSEPFIFGFLGGSGLLGNPELFGRAAGFLVRIPAPPLGRLGLAAMFRLACV